MAQWGDLINIDKTNLVSAFAIPLPPELHHSLPSSPPFQDATNSPLPLHTLSPSLYHTPPPPSTLLPLSLPHPPSITPLTYLSLYLSLTYPLLPHPPSRPSSQRRTPRKLPLRTALFPSRGLPSAHFITDSKNNSKKKDTRTKKMSRHTGTQTSARTGTQEHNQAHGQTLEQSYRQPD